MTDEEIADVIYIEPLTPEAIERVIEKELPDGILPTLGGQTGLNLAVQLAERGVLDKYNVRLLGTPLDAIRNAEDRNLFRQLLLDISEPVPPSETVTTIARAKYMQSRDLAHHYRAHRAIRGYASRIEVITSRAIRVHASRIEVITSRAIRLSLPSLSRAKYMQSRDLAHHYAYR